MCKVGDLIVVNSYKTEDGKIIGKHTFLVLDDRVGTIYGLNYDLVCNVLSSFKSDDHRIKKLRRKENVEIKNTDVDVNSGNSKDGFIKADQLHYFDKSTTDFWVIGSVNENVLTMVMELIELLDRNGKLIINTKNLAKTKTIA